MANQEQLKVISEGIEAWNKWREDNPDEYIDLSELDFCSADLTEIDLMMANLCNCTLNDVNFSNANLTGAILNNAELKKANLSNANLADASLGDTNFVEANLTNANLSSSSAIGANFSKANLTNTNFNNANLTGADLSNAHLNNSNLRKATLEWAKVTNADLRGANLTQVRALETDFSEADFTGACIESWTINLDTNLNNIICDYIYRKSELDTDSIDISIGNEKFHYIFIERLPLNENDIFNPGDFTKIYRQSNIIELIFNRGVDWISFAFAFKQLAIENKGAKLNVKKIRNDQGLVVVDVEISQNADKQKIEGSFWQGYEFARKTLTEQNEKIILNKDKEINRLFTIITQTQEVQKIMAEESKNKQYFNGPVYGVAGNVERDQNIYASEQKQTLTEAAAEIQQLLDQLSESYPTNTTVEKMTVAQEATKRIKGNPQLTQKLLQLFSAGKAGTIAAIDSMLNHPAASFLIAAMEDLQNNKEG